MGQKKPKRTTAKKVQSLEDKPFVFPEVTAKAEVDEEGWGNDGLTTRQRLFVEALIGTAGGNATKAAEIAGYNADNRNSLKVTASENLTKPNVQRAIERAVAARFGSADDVRRGICAIANGSAADYLDRGTDGKLAISLEKLAEAGMLGLVHEIREEGFEHDGQLTIIKRKLKLYDRLKALELLAKMNGQMVERRDITSGGQPINQPNHLQRMMQGVMSDPAAFEALGVLADRFTETDDAVDRN